MKKIISKIIMFLIAILSLSAASVKSSVCIVKPQLSEKITEFLKTTVNH